MFLDEKRTTVKIIDLGLGKNMESQDISHTFAGTIDYVGKNHTWEKNPRFGFFFVLNCCCFETAPEMLQGGEYDYKKIDVWSVGCIVFFMYVFSSLFNDGN
jgi:serine/threonine protein kinase